MNNSKSIPATVRNIVWATYIGKNKSSDKCFVCNNESITKANFECGHIISRNNGGSITVENLRPLCSMCNKSIGKNNVDEFMEKFKIEKRLDWDGQLKNINPNSSVLDCPINNDVDVVNEIQAKIKASNAYKCIICNYRSKNKYNHAKHIETKKHIKNMKTIFQCKYCDIICYTKASLLEHFANCKNI